MRPSSPTPQGLRQVRHPSIFPSRRERIRGTIQVKLSFQIGGFLTRFRSHFSVFGGILFTPPVGDSELLLAVTEF